MWCIFHSLPQDCNWHKCYCNEHCTLHLCLGYIFLASLSSWVNQISYQQHGSEYILLQNKFDESTFLGERKRLPWESTLHVVHRWMIKIFRVCMNGAIIVYINSWHGILEPWQYSLEFIVHRWQHFMTVTTVFTAGWQNLTDIDQTVQNVRVWMTEDKSNIMIGYINVYSTGLFARWVYTLQCSVYVCPLFRPLSPFPPPRASKMLSTLLRLQNIIFTMAFCLKGKAMVMGPPVSCGDL